MNEKSLQSPQHNNIRTFLRVVGPLVGVVGILFTIVGFASFFSAFGGFGPPRYFWCAFVGLPLLFLSVVLCMFGYLGAIHRYVAGEAAPVARDAVNFMGEGVQPGVKAVAKAVAEGIFEARKEQQP